VDRGRERGGEWEWGGGTGFEASITGNVQPSASCTTLCSQVCPAVAWGRIMM
jgi:hypothetical protein